MTAATEGDVSTVASLTCGIHAQVQASAELQLAVRVNGLTQQDVRGALWERRELVKAWTVRGTLHLHPADELALWFAAQRAARGSPDDQALAAWRDPAGVRHPRLEPDEANAIRAAIWDALDGRSLLREELVEAIVGRVGPAPRERLLSGFAFFFDELCQGPPQGARITLARPDQWIDGWREVDEQKALLEVCRRYLRTYGPARPGDFREWLARGATTGAHAGTAFDSLGDELQEIDVEGHRAWMLAGDTVFPESRSSVKLLPEYDVYVMGFRERGQLVPEDARVRLKNHVRGRYEGPAGVRWLLVDGIARGMWERKKRSKTIELRAEPLIRLTRSQRAALAEEAERIGRFFGLRSVLSVG